jgi:hypothetical protein
MSYVGKRHDAFLRVHANAFLRERCRTDLTTLALFL